MRNRRVPFHSTRFPAAFCLGFLLTACGVGSDTQRVGGGRTVKDGLGRSVTITTDPRRIVALAPSVTESLLALEFGQRVVGVTKFCEIPDEMTGISRIGGMLNPNLEAIEALRPDLMIGTTSGNDPSLQAQSAGLGIPLYTVHTPDVESMLNSLQEIADLLGRPENGRRLVDRLRSRLDRVARSVAGRRPPRALFIVWSEPLVVPGRSAFLTDAMRLAGADSVTADAAGAHPAFDLESAVARRPEVILTTPENRRLVESLGSNPAWQSVPAVRSGRIHVLGPAIVRPGPGVISGIEEMAVYLQGGEVPDGRSKKAANRGIAVEQLSDSRRATEADPAAGRNK